MSNYSKIINNQNTNSPIVGRKKDMIKNAEGAYVFAIDKWRNAERWLILGSASGNYYVGKVDLTLKNVENLSECINEDGKRLVDMIVDISTTNRSATNETCVFALAYCCVVGDKEVRSYALSYLESVCRISTDLYRFVDSLFMLGGKKWNRSLRRAISSWYDNKTEDKVAYQLVKYISRRVREGDGNSAWSHNDLIKLSHPKKHSKLYGYAIGKVNANETDNKLISSIAELSNVSIEKAVSLISENKIPHEAVPNNIKNESILWETLAVVMPLGALIRNLPKITSVGALDNKEVRDTVIERLGNKDYILKSRIHPMGILKALNGYKVGSNRNMTWQVNRHIVDALDGAYYLSFGNVESSGKDIMLAIDVSGSMSYGDVLGINGMSPKVAACALALPTLAVEKDADLYWFAREVKSSSVSAKTRLDTAVKESCEHSGGTDISCVVQYALDNKKSYDVFVIYTDGDTNSFTKHPYSVLQEYRKKVNKNAKMVVVALQATNYSVGDQKDAGTLDLVGCDTATPSLITNFICDKI